MNKKALEAVAKNKLVMGIAEQKSGDFTFYVPFWSDNRKLFSHPDLLKVIAKELGKIIIKLKHKGIKVDCVAGIPNIGLPLAWAISLLTSIKALYIQKERKKYLIPTYVQGDFKAGEQAVLIDDVLGVGGTKDEMIAKAQEDGLMVTHILTMANAFPKKNKEKIEGWKNKGIGYSCLFTREELMDYLVDSGRISKDAYDIHTAYAAEPASWVKDKKIMDKFHKWKKSIGVETGETF